jgi:hypothetical protein
VYAVKLIRGYLASLTGLIGIAYGISYLQGQNSFAETLPVIVGNPALFHMLIVAPSEELVFRFFVPLLLMVLFGMNYLVGGVIGGIIFGLAHWWAYGQNDVALSIAILAGMWQAVVVYLYSNREESFSFKPGLLAAMLGHGTYNVLISTAPELALMSGVITGLALGASYMFRRELES